MNFTKCFFCIYWNDYIVSVFSFEDVACNTLMWLGIINCPQDPRVNPTRSCFLILFMYCIGFSLLIFCWELLHLYLSNILTCDFLLFFFLVIIFGFDIRMMVALQNEFGSVPFSSVFWNSLSIDVVEFLSETIWS